MPTALLTIESLCAGLGIPDRVLNFEDVAGGRVVFGPGTLSVIGVEAAALGGKKVLIVTDPGIARTSGRSGGFIPRGGRDLRGGVRPGERESDH